MARVNFCCSSLAPRQDCAIFTDSAALLSRSPNTESCVSCRIQLKICHLAVEACHDQVPCTRRAGIILWDYSVSSRDPVTNGVTVFSFVLLCFVIIIIRNITVRIIWR